MISNDQINLNSIINTISFGNKFHGTTMLIKLGGSILDDDAIIKSLCHDLKLLKESGIKIIIVHGGSKAINTYLSLNNITSEFVAGLRITSVEAMTVIEMVLCGHVNTKLVRQLNSIGVKATGLSGADNNMLQCEYFSEQHGCVGSINSISTDLISQLLSPNTNAMHYSSIPVIAPVGVDLNGNAMNINADYAASYIATAMKVDKLIYMTDQDGIHDNNGSIYQTLSPSDLQQLITNNTVTGGMLTKTKAILSALDGNLTHVHILNGNKQHVLIEELFTENCAGTLCTNLQSYNQELEAVA